MAEKDYKTISEQLFEAQIEAAKQNLEKKGATLDEIDDYIYSLRCIEELNNKYFAN